jgi:hypothetical protein
MKVMKGHDGAVEVAQSGSTFLVIGDDFSSNEKVTICHKKLNL